MIKNVSYIIGYRESNFERKNALNFVLRWLIMQFPEIEIIIVEQDSISKLTLPENSNIIHKFVYNPDLYNRCWAFNVGVNCSDKEYFVFADSDVFMNRADFISTLDTLKSFDAVTPNKVSCINVEIASLEALAFNQLDERKIWTFASMLLFITKEAYFKIGGWDESFEGWGAEDNAMSHIIYNKISSKAFEFPIFHIDHPRSILDGNTQPKYEANKLFAEEIELLHSDNLERHIKNLKQKKWGDPYKYSQSILPIKSKEDLLHFVLAITTYNRVEYLKELISTFSSTRSNCNWTIIIADDGSDDGTLEYINSISIKGIKVYLINNSRRDICFQSNSILKKLDEFEYDCCFMSDDDVYFLQPGWDMLYYNTIRKTGYDHLIFYDLNWRPELNFDKPNVTASFQNSCKPINLQGAFYTITPRVVSKVGYFDAQNFGPRSLEHVDYSFRCCRAGFNNINSPWDMKNSNDFVKLQSRENYKRSISLNLENKIHSEEEILARRKILLKNRIFVPFNENLSRMDVYLSSKPKLSKQFLESDSKPAGIQRADTTYYPKRGVFGIFGLGLKFFYNLCIDLRLYFFCRFIKKIGIILSRISLDLINIDK